MITSIADFIVGRRVAGRRTNLSIDLGTITGIGLIRGQAVAYVSWDTRRPTGFGPVLDTVCFRDLVPVSPSGW